MIDIICSSRRSSFPRRAGAPVERKRHERSANLKAFSPTMPPVSEFCRRDFVHSVHSLMRFLIPTRIRQCRLHGARYIELDAAHWFSIFEDTLLQRATTGNASPASCRGRSCWPRVVADAAPLLEAERHEVSGPGFATFFGRCRPGSAGNSEVGQRYIIICQSTPHHPLGVRRRRRLQILPPRDNAYSNAAF